MESYMDLAGEGREGEEREGREAVGSKSRSRCVVKGIMLGLCVVHRLCMREYSVLYRGIHASDKTTTIQFGTQYSEIN